jgi:hypothetical protein
MPKLKHNASTSPSVGFESRKCESWWRHCSFLKFVDQAPGKPVASTDGGFWFETFWKPREASIWAYELCRRLSRLKGKTTIDPKIRELLGALPPYPDLTHLQRLSLTLVFEAQARLDGLEEAQKGEAWKSGDIYRLLDWRLVEELDLPPSKGDPNKFDERKKRRENSIAYAKRYVDLVLAAVGSPTLLGRLQIPDHDLTGFSFSTAHLERVLSKSS